MEAPSVDLAAEIGRLIRQNLGVNAGAALDEDLIASGVLDSLTLIQLLADMEPHFSVTLPLEDLEIEEVRSVALLARLVARLKSGRAGATLPVSEGLSTIGAEVS